MSNISIFEGDALERLIREIGALKGEVSLIAKERNNLIKPHMTVKELQEYLCVGAKWVELHKAEIGFTKLGRELRFKRRDVEEYLEAGYFKRGLSPLRAIKQKSR